jgi:YbbR domain-containing protein
VPVFIPETEMMAAPETTSEVIAPAQAVAEATVEPAMPTVTPGKVTAGSFKVNAGASSASYLPTFFGGTVITGPANVAVTSPNNTANINITVKRGVLIPNVQR